MVIDCMHAGHGDDKQHRSDYLYFQTSDVHEITSFLFHCGKLRYLQTAAFGEELDSVSIQQQVLSPGFPDNRFDAAHTAKAQM